MIGIENMDQEQNGVSRHKNIRMPAPMKRQKISLFCESGGDKDKGERRGSFWAFLAGRGEGVRKWEDGVPPFIHSSSTGRGGGAGGISREWGKPHVVEEMLGI